ncbi:MAG: lysostaphin resistance A-like protein [Hyphomicrobiales bacterium]
MNKKSSLNKSLLRTWSIISSVIILAILTAIWTSLYDLSSIILNKYTENYIAFFALAMAFSTIATSIILTVSYSYKLKKQISIWGLNKKFSTKNFWIYALSAAFVLIIATFIITITKDADLNYNELISLQFLNIIFFLFIAINEEFTFRMFLFSKMKRRFKPFVALLLSSLIFALYHLITPNIDTLAIINLFLIGMFFNLGYISSGSIYLPIIMHFIWNIVQGPILGFSVSGLIYESLFSVNITNPDIINGGNYGLENSIIVTALLIIANIILIRKEMKAGKL